MNKVFAVYDDGSEDPVVVYDNLEAAEIAADAIRRGRDTIHRESRRSKEVWVEEIDVYSKFDESQI